MFMPMCQNSRCRNPLEIRRQYSSAAMAGPNSTRSFAVCPLEYRIPRNIATLIPIRMYVAIGSTAIERSVCTCVRCFEQSGQRMPTGVGVMQSGQMGLPQFEQETPVSRPGWR